MTVAELMEVLKRAPQDMQVQTEGCDCAGDVGKAVLMDDCVMLCRTDGYFVTVLSEVGATPL